ncbi:MAG: hypothetical protein IH598_11350 [Bacteroidales bacterium]|nr:hypothetical protein [Bacteroidales bacterium]
MKKLLFIFFFLSFLLNIKGAEGYDVIYTRINPTTSTVKFTLGEFSLRPDNLSGTDFTRILFSGSVTTMDEGFAELPFINANIQIDPLKNVRIVVIAEEFTDYPLDFPLVPSRGVIYRDQDPSLIPYFIAPESLMDDFYPGELIGLTDPFIIKDARGVTVYVYPFQYNAVQQSLRVFTRVTVEFSEDDTEPVNPLKQPSGKFFPEMEALYHSVFLNYENTTDLAVGEAGDILVITTARDESAIQPYIDWKKQKGHGITKEVVATGTNVKSLIQSKYNQNNSILYVQLVGDWADIKCDLGGGANAPMDPMLGCVVGTDNFPDIAIGRFSANNATQVTVQVNKTINYEKLPSGTWYPKAISVASDEGAGIGDDGEIDYVHTNVIYNNKLDPFTYDGHSTAYEPSATALQVKNYIEAGASIINYCGHGSMNSWGTTGFSNTHVNQLTNGAKLPYIFSVACVNGAFHLGDCFAEAWLRKENGGAVMTLMATINQPWQPPMRGQDYFNDLLTGGYNYTANPGNGINTTEGRTVLGSIVVNGLILMYTESAGTSDLQTIQTWTTFGDPSLQARTKTPATPTLTNMSLTVGSPFETIVKVNGIPFKGALVSVSQNGTFASAYSGDNGAVSIPNNFIPGDVLLVVTGFNLQPIYQTIQCSAAGGPAVYFNHVIVNDQNGNQNGRLDYGETAGLTVGMKNTGYDPAQNVVATLSTANSFITILNPTANFGNMAPGQLVTITNAFTIQVASNVPNGQSIIFNLTANDGSSSWESSFSLFAYAGQLAFIGFEIEDPYGNNNNKLDPGETVDLIISMKNPGASAVTGTLGQLTITDPYITIAQQQMNYGTLPAGATVERTYQITAGSSVPAGYIVPFEFLATADLGLELLEFFDVIIGQIPVLIIDFDTNHNSSDKIVAAMQELDVSANIVTTMPENLELYSSVFLCLGIYPFNHVLTQAHGQAFADYLNGGGKMYVEGGDTWYYDPKTPMHSMFGINATGDGGSDLGTIVGHSGTFTEGLSFTYNSENSYIDRLSATNGGVVILSNLAPAYGTAVINSTTSYQTIGASHEFGGLLGDRTTLMEGYLDYFGLLPPPPITQFIMIPDGWSGLSSCLIPENSSLEEMLEPIMGELIILQSLEGVFYPELSINTIGNWNHQQGYKIKLENPVMMQVSGWVNPNKQVDLQSGWNMIPVISECDVEVVSFFSGISGQLQIVKEIAGSGVYWPAMGINTLGQLKAGQAYLVRVSTDAEIIFPECDK